MRHLLFMSPLALGCELLKVPISVSGACDTVSYGYKTPSSDAKEALEQTNCYRNLMGLSRGQLNPQLDDAAQGHADYMAQIGTITHRESSAEEGFTGEWVDDRMEAAGYAIAPGSMSSEVVAYGYDPAGAVDAWVGTVYHRVPFTMPTWTAQGFGQTGDFSSMSFVTPFPDGAHRVVIFPADGQTQVPTSFDSDTEVPDPAPGLGLVGYPITVTVAAAETTGSDPYNPYGLTLIDAGLWGPGGEEIDILTLDPTMDDTIYLMVAIVPTEPLEPGETYEAEISVEWAEDARTLYTSFTTASPEE